MSDPLENPRPSRAGGSQLGIVVVVVGAVAAWRLAQARSRRRAKLAAEAPVLPEPAAELAG